MLGFKVLFWPHLSVGASLFFSDKARFDKVNSLPHSPPAQDQCNEYTITGEIYSGAVCTHPQSQARAKAAGNSKDWFTTAFLQPLP